MLKDGCVSLKMKSIDKNMIFTKKTTKVVCSFNFKYQ